jgi:hypothetical protein
MNATVVGALAGLLGLVLGRLWDIRSEVSRWRRDQRAGIYERLAGAYYSLREALRKLAMSEPGTAESETAESRSPEAAAEWNREVIAAWLHGTKAVTKAIQQLDHEVVNLFLRVLGRDRRLTLHQVQADRAPMQEALQRYVEAVRKEFKQPNVKVDVVYIGNESASSASSQKTDRISTSDHG